MLVDCIIIVIRQDIKRRGRKVSEGSIDPYETWIVCKANTCCWYCYTKRRHFLADDFSLVCPLSVMSQFNIRSHLLHQEAAAETSYITRLPELQSTYVTRHSIFLAHTNKCRSSSEPTF